MHAKTLDLLVKFLNNRIIELVGFTLFIFSICLLAALITYSPSDPNFLYTPEKGNINNILGINGSIVSDFLLQSIGLISFLFIFNLLIWGLKLIRIKSVNNFLSRIFYTIIYILCGTTFIFIYKNNSFWLIDNGNSGFIGRIMNENFLNLIILDNNYYITSFLFLLTLIFFSLSLDLKIKQGVQFIKMPYLITIRIFQFFFQKKDATTSEENIDLDINQKSKSDIIEKNSQPNLPFRMINDKINLRNKFKLPPINYLEINLSKKKIGDDESIIAKKNSDLLEKILSDFGIEGKIKRISCGPVVTLNEFEPSAGVRVSQIVNLSDDIARYTSSVSTRIATIPGKNTVGIEIPNSKRENVFLSEIIKDSTFSKKNLNYL